MFKNTLTYKLKKHKKYEIDFEPVLPTLDIRKTSSQGYGAKLSEIEHE